MSEQPQELDRKDLKVLGYRQKLSELEEKFNELQVDFTIVSEQAQNAFKEVERLNALQEESKPAGDDTSASAGDVSTN